MRQILLLVFFLLFVLSQVHAISIGVSPGRVRFDNLLEDGYAERTITITTNTGDVLFGHLEVNGDIAEWVRFSPDSVQFNVSSHSPYRLAIIIEPPTDIPSGNYSGSIDVITDAVSTIDGRAGGIVKAAVTLLINAEITKDQVVECRAGAFFLGDTELEFPLEFGATVINDGNVRMQPTLDLEVWDQEQESLVLSREYQADTILPTTQQRIMRSQAHDLSLGQYWAKLSVRECNQDQLLTFNVVEKGAIVDQGVFAGIFGKPDAQIGETVEFIAKFENQGPRSVSAKFKGNVRLDDTIIKLVETDEILVDPGAIVDFNIFFTPQEKGKHSIQGRIIYNKKLTYEKGSSLVVEASAEEEKHFGLLPLLLYLILIVTILFLFRKIVKERRKRRF